MNEAIMTRVTRANWADFDGVDAPAWMTEELGNYFCSLLNAYIPEEHGRRGCRYHLLHRYSPNPVLPAAELYFHLINRPYGQ